MSTLAHSPASLDALFRPRSIAVIGASADADRIGGRPLRYLRDGGFQGAIYPVNPHRTTVQGLDAYPSVDAIPGVVDLAIVALSAELVPDALQACADKGVAVAIVFSAGFAEVGGAGVALQLRIGEIVRRSGMRVLGPNCLGAFDTASGFFGTFTQAFDSGFTAPGEVAIASQSGACGGHLAYLCRQRKIGIRYWVTTGNEVDIDLSESLLWLAHAPEVRVIVAYAEAVRDGPTFLKALAAARRNGKPVIMLKVGRSSAGARAAASHTGALAGTDAVYHAVLRQYGVYRAETIEQMLDLAYACSFGVYPPSATLGIVTVSGGVGVQMADAAERFGLATPALPPAAQDCIRAFLPFAGVNNPIDVTAQAVNDRSLIGRCIDVALAEGGYGALVCFFTSAPAVPAICETLLEALQAMRQRFPDRLIVLAFVAPTEIVRRFETAGFPVFEDVDRAIATIAALACFAASFAAHPAEGIADALQTPVLSAMPLPAVLDEHDAKQILREAGIFVPTEHLVADAAGAHEAAAAIGGSVALKIVSSDLPHKTEVGGVVLDLRSPAAAAAAAQAMLNRIGREHPAARLRGVLVSPMYGEGLETICGVFTDAVFGPVLMFGLGGIHVEVLRDVSFALAPLDRPDALRLVRSIRAQALLDGVRGGQPVDVDAIADVLCRLSDLAIAHRGSITEIDINPLRVFARGQGCVALDALITTRRLAGGTTTNN